jgi:hypothetical protein
MNLENFRRLGTPDGDQNGARCNLIANLIATQFKWLRRGDDMTGPVGLFKGGSAQPPPGFYVNNVKYDDQRGFTAVTTQTVHATIDQIYAGHPWIKIVRQLDDANYFHMNTVDIVSIFGSKQAGEMVTVRVIETRHVFEVPLTQEMIDSTSSIVIRLALSP